MCETCWERAGSPTELPASFTEFREWYDDLYLFCPTGGPLHAVLDDWNLDGHIEPYPGLDFIDEYDQRDNTEHVYDLCGVIATLLNAMTTPERYAALAAIEEYFDLAREGEG